MWWLEAPWEMLQFMTMFMRPLWRICGCYHPRIWDCYVKAVFSQQGPVKLPRVHRSFHDHAERSLISDPPPCFTSWQQTSWVDGNLRLSPDVNCGKCYRWKMALNTVCFFALPLNASGFQIAEEVIVVLSVQSFCGTHSVKSLSLLVALTVAFLQMHIL